MSVQAPLHKTVPAAQSPVTQALLVQIWPAAHGMLQAPQWSELLAGSAQSPPQSIWGGTQLTRQAPATQACPTVHATPHMPQLSGSLVVSAVQVPEPPEPPEPPELAPPREG